jgi:hypothetical protein
VITGDYRDLFVAIASCAATLIGLLFVAISVSTEHARSHPQVMREFRSAASLLAFTNAFTVAFFGLVPGNNIGYPAAIVGTFGLVFTAAGVRTILSLPAQHLRRRPQIGLVVALLLIFGFQITYGIELVINPTHVGKITAIGDVLIASLLIGIGRAWELVGDWDTGIISSIGRLIGHQARPPGAMDAERSEDPE